MIVCIVVTSRIIPDHHAKTLARLVVLNHSGLVLRANDQCQTFACN